MDNLEEHNGIKMHAVFPDYEGNLIDKATETEYFVGRNKAGRLYQLGLRIFGLEKDGSKRTIGNPFDFITGHDEFVINKQDWYDFLTSTRGRAYVTSRVAVLNASVALAKEIEKVGGFDFIKDEYDRIQFELGDYLVNSLELGKGNFDIAALILPYQISEFVLKLSANNLVKDLGFNTNVCRQIIYDNITPEEFKKYIETNKESDIDKTIREKTFTPYAESKIEIKVPKIARVKGNDEHIYFRMPNGHYSDYVYKVKRNAVRLDNNSYVISYDSNLSNVVLSKFNDKNIKTLSVINFNQYIDEHNDYSEYDSSILLKNEFNRVITNKNLIPQEFKDLEAFSVCKCKYDENINKMIFYSFSCTDGNFVQPQESNRLVSLEKALEFGKNNRYSNLAVSLDKCENIGVLEINNAYLFDNFLSKSVENIIKSFPTTYMQKKADGTGIQLFFKHDRLNEYRTFSKDRNLRMYFGKQFINLTQLNTEKHPIADFTNNENFNNMLNKYFYSFNSEMKNIPLSEENKLILGKLEQSKNSQEFKKLFYSNPSIHENKTLARTNMLTKIIFWTNGNLNKAMEIFDKSALNENDEDRTIYENQLFKAKEKYDSYKRKEYISRSEIKANEVSFNMITKHQ